MKTLLERGADPNIRDEGDNAVPDSFRRRARRSLHRHSCSSNTAQIRSGPARRMSLTCSAGRSVGTTPITLEVARYLLANGAKSHAASQPSRCGDADGDPRVGEIGRRSERSGWIGRIIGAPRRISPSSRSSPRALAALIDLGAEPESRGCRRADAASIRRRSTANDEMTRLLIDARRRDHTAAPRSSSNGRTRSSGSSATIPKLLSTTRQPPMGAAPRARASGRASGRVLARLLDAIMRHRAGLSIVNMEDDEETAVDGAPRYTPLHAAAFHGNDEAAAVLLKHGANPRTRDGKYCGTPAGWAALCRAHRDGGSHPRCGRRHLRCDRLRPRRPRRPTFSIAIPAPSIGRSKRTPRADHKEGQWWPSPDCTPLEWAATQGEAERGPCLDRARRRLANAERHPTRRAASSRLPSVRVLGPSRARQTGPPDARPRGAASSRRGSVDRRRQYLYRDRVRRSSGSRSASSRSVRKPRARAAAPGVGRRSCIWRTRGLRIRPTIEQRPADCASAASITALIRTTSTWPATHDTRCSAAPLAKASRTRRGSRMRPSLFDLLLERGADPFDHSGALQHALQRRHVCGGSQLVYEHTINTPRGVAWRDPEWPMFDMGAYGSGARFVLETAVKKRDLALAEWALARGANPERGARARQEVSQAQSV